MFRSFRYTLLIATAAIGMSVVATAAVPDPVAATTGAVAPANVATPAAGAAPVDKDPNLVGRVEQRITDLHAKLQITAVQQPQWDRFAAVMRDNARSMVQGFDARVEKLPTMTAPESMQSYATMAMEHATEMQKLVPAFSALYATMSDAQKKVTDTVFLDEAHGGQPKAAG
jgi:hypothetical protein